MFEFIDFNALLLGAGFALALSGAIVLFLVHAALNAPQVDENTNRMSRFGKWTSLSRYDGRRIHFHAAGHDPELYEW
ncbi:MAG: hypothetical protein CL610_26465 [Anaerolineaceae bacterium]|nr:hypothetical protein [Anaerolineaceae bacterium]